MQDPGSIEGGAEAECEELGCVEIYSLLWWTVPIHALLPVAIGLLVSWDAALGESIVSWFWVIVHLAFPAVLIASYPWWRGRGDAVAVVVIVNHIVTFAVGILLLGWR